jgi:hypothetical protein
MIKEEYVSFEVAKLLKEKGFNEYCWKLYEFGDCDMPVLLNGFELDSESGFWNNEYLELYKKEHSYINDICSAPTLQMAMRWLRETFNIHVVPKRDFYGGFYTGRIYDGRRELTADKEDYIACAGYDTYEEAANIAIKYCLEKMI